MTGERLIYVIHKHKATRLHYDFRLQVRGVLVSWAVPKGPSLSTKDKRLAVRVDDHDLSYAGFEGRIAAGNYGAGSVIVWDNGTWRPIGEPAPEAQLKAGKLKFTVYGKKLAGEWTLLKMRGNDKNWLLIKAKDKYVSDGDITQLRPESVISGRTLEEIESDSRASVIDCSGDSFS